MSASVNTTLLIADDDPSHLLLAEAALAGAGFLVHTASDGEEAVRRFGEVSMPRRARSRRGPRRRRRSTRSGAGRGRSFGASSSRPSRRR